MLSTIPVTSVSDVVWGEGSFEIFLFVFSFDFLIVILHYYIVINAFRAHFLNEPRSSVNDTQL